jgi:hypothetical protein
MDPPIQSPSDDPYRPPAAPTKFDPPPGSLEYLRMWRFAFDNSQWVVTVLLITAALALSGFIPILPALIVYGYQFEVIEDLHRSGGRSYPDFNIDRFADYLVRGVWVMVAALLGFVLMVPVLLAAIGCGVGLLMAAMSAAGSEDAAAAVAAVGFPLLVLFVVAVVIPLNVLLCPLLLRAGLSQDLGAAFNFDWIKSFASKTWREMLAGTLFLMASGLAATVVGMLLCCIGVYPAMALAALAQSHLFFQLYELFLARGGEPILLKEPARQGW